jgi:GDP-L-fucose synthase
MEKTSKIYIAGHQGMVGSALVRRLQADGYDNLLLRSSRELDLRRQADVEAFFAAERPDYVFLAAAKVGGILANNTYPADFMFDNLAIAMNVIHAAQRTGVRKLLFLGSSCIYPKYAAQPIREDSLLTGALEPTNEAYALAKIAGLKYCEYLNRQYGTDYISCMPTNLYGPRDNYHPEHSHVLPALIRRFHEAKVSGAPAVTVWGTGQVLREFLYVDDLADACVFLMTHYSGLETVNIGTGVDQSIGELARLVQETVGYTGELVFDTTKPDGTPRKLLDVSKLAALGWTARTDLREGLRRTYEDFLNNPTRAER